MTFEKEHGRCICNECFYGFNCLMAEDFEIYQFEGMTLKDGQLVTPELVSAYFRACDKLFRKQYHLETRSLEELCLSSIQKAKDLNTTLLPVSLRKSCEEFSERKLPRWYPEWAIPSVLVKHLGFRVKLVAKRTE